MRAKEYLSQLKNLDIKINHKIQELYELKQGLFSFPSVDYSDFQEGKTVSGDARFVIKITDIEEKYTAINTEIERYIDLKHEIINRIHQLSCSMSMELLFKRYVEFKRFEVIAVEMSYTYSWTKHLHRRALKKFEDQQKTTPKNTF